VTGTTTVSAVGGIATFSNLILNTSGAYTLTAASGGLTSATSTTITIGAGTASKLVFTTEPPSSGTAATAFTAVIQVEDASGNLVTSSTASVAITSTASGVTGTTTVSAVGGIATFSNLTLSTTGAYTLTAASSGLTSATSSSIMIGAGTASKLAFTTEPPSSGTAGTAFTAVVQVEDASGNLVTSSTASVTITSTASGVTGTTTVSAVGGVATFSNLILNTSGTYTLTAASSGLTSVTSSSITINSAGSNVSGQVSLNNCGSGGNQPFFTVSINTTPTATTTTDSSGNYSFTGIPNGTYTITPSIAGASSSLFYPPSITGVTLNNSSNNNLTGQNFNAVVGYTVSGAVSYTTGVAAQNGQTYLVLNSTNCGGGSGGPGTSISQATLNTGGAFTIRGVPPGSYTLQAWMDPIGEGLQNAIDPTGSSSVTVSNANITDAAVQMNNPTYATPSSNPSINSIIPNAQGMLIEYGISKNSNSVEDANQYVVEWSTSPTLGGGTGGAQFQNIAGSHTFTANGDKGVWILTNSVAGAGSFASSQTYYFQVRSFNTLDTANPHPSGWCNYTASGCSGTTGFTGVTIGTPSCSVNCTSVSGTVTIPSGITCPSNPSLSICTGASLYLGMIEFDSSGGNPIGIYATEITNPPTGANNFTVTVPNGSNYAVLGILDQNNVGEFGPGVITNVGDKVSANITVSGGTMPGQTGTLPTANSVAYVQTNYYQSTSSSGSSTGYQLNFDVSGSNKLPVAVTLTSGPNLINNNGTVAIDMSNCTDCGNPQFDYYVTLPGGTPALNDTYGFTVTYSDGSQETGSTVNGKVTAFGSTGAIAGPSDLVTNLSPSANSNTSLTPTFTWTFPSGASTANYYYSFYISQSNCSGPCGNVWQVPGNNSKSNGFTYAETGSGTTGTLTWGTDPIPGESSTPTGSLVPNSIYNWQIQVQDSNGNQAQTQTWYQP
jgi:hypothetical protein